MLAKDKLAIWFYLNENDSDESGHKLKLVKDESSEGGVSTVSGDNFLVSKQSVGSLDIRGIGDLSLQIRNVDRTS